MFGVEKRVKRVRDDLVRALNAKKVKIMMAHQAKKPEDIPKVDLTRAMVLGDIAEIIQSLGVEETVEDKA